MKFSCGADEYELDYCCHKDHWRGANRIWVCKKIGMEFLQYNVADDDFFVENNKIYANIDLEEPVTWP